MTPDLCPISVGSYMQPLHCAAVTPDLCPISVGSYSLAIVQLSSKLLLVEGCHAIVGDMGVWAVL